MRDVRSKVDKWGKNEKDRIAISTNGKQLAVGASQQREKFSLHISYRRIPLAEERYHSLHMFRQQWSLCKVVWIAVCLCVDMSSIKSLAWMQSLHAVGCVYVRCIWGCFGSVGSSTGWYLTKYGLGQEQCYKFRFVMVPACSMWFPVTPDRIDKFTVIMCLNKDS